MLLIVKQKLGLQHKGNNYQIHTRNSVLVATLREIVSLGLQLEDINNPDSTP